MHLQPYRNFNGRCEEALEFYKKALGAEVTMLMRLKEKSRAAPAGGNNDRRRKSAASSVPYWRRRVHGNPTVLY